MPSHDGLAKLTVGSSLMYLESSHDGHPDGMMLFFLSAVQNTLQVVELSLLRCRTHTSTSLLDLTLSVLGGS